MVFVDMGWTCRVLLVVITVTSFVKPGQGAGAWCWLCPFWADSRETTEAESQAKQESCRTTGERYIPYIAVTEQFCDELRDGTAWVKELCVVHPTGYTVLCERMDRSGQVVYEKCSSTYCPREPEQSGRQTGSDAPSQHASSSSFRLLAGTALVVSATTMMALF